MFKIDTEKFNLTLVRLAYQNKLEVFEYLYIPTRSVGMREAYAEY